jgi:hypothetical protein
MTVGLSIRWSLSASGDVAGELRRYVVEQSLPRFTGRPGLCFKTWRMRPGEWFEGTYVFDTAASRDEFEAWVRSAPSPVTALVGAEPVLIEHVEVVAVAEGGAGFTAGPGPGSGA